jgi:hypothetical protein
VGRAGSECLVIMAGSDIKGARNALQRWLQEQEQALTKGDDEDVVVGRQGGHVLMYIVGATYGKSSTFGSASGVGRQGRHMLMLVGKSSAFGSASDVVENKAWAVGSPKVLVCLARPQAVSPAKPGQSDGLPRLLAWPGF